MPLRLPRRALLIGGGVAAAIGWTEVVWPRLARLLAPEIAFQPISELPGFRRLETGAEISGGFDPFVGLQASDTGWRTGLPEPALSRTPCTALYGHPPDGRVQMAVFTDYNCPYCRILDRRLLQLAETRADEVTLKVHQLPLLAETSLWGARGALAAGQQDAYLAFHKRLMGAAFSIDPNYLQEVARSLNLDGARLMQDAKGPEVTRQLAESRGFAGRLGIVGTPGLLVGRSLVMGNVTDEVLEQLIRLEAAEASAPDCAVFA